MVRSKINVMFERCNISGTKNTNDNGSCGNTGDDGHTMGGFVAYIDSGTKVDFYNCQSSVSLRNTFTDFWGNVINTHYGGFVGHVRGTCNIYNGSSTGNNNKNKHGRTSPGVALVRSGATVMVSKLYYSGFSCGSNYCNAGRPYQDCSGSCTEQK